MPSAGQARDELVDFRALCTLPYREGASMLHVLGNPAGGGDEWVTPGRVRKEIIPAEVDDDRLITRATPVGPVTGSNATLTRLLTATA